MPPRAVPTRSPALEGAFPSGKAFAAARARTRDRASLTKDSGGPFFMEQPQITGIFDSHAHYDDPAFDPDRDQLLAGLGEMG